VAKKTYKAWCIWSPDVGPLFATVRKTKTDAIDAWTCCAPEDRDREWRWWKAKGHRCVRVVITEKGAKR
jgi:hypothetical protein